MGRNISGHQTDHEMKIIQDLFPSWEDNGRRMDNLKGNRTELSQWLVSKVSRDLII